MVFSHHLFLTDPVLLHRSAQPGAWSEQSWWSISGEGWSLGCPLSRDATHCHVKWLVIMQNLCFMIFSYLIGTDRRCQLRLVGNCNLTSLSFQNFLCLCHSCILWQIKRSTKLLFWPSDHEFLVPTYIYYVFLHRDAASISFRFVLVSFHLVWIYIAVAQCFQTGRKRTVRCAEGGYPL